MKRESVRIALLEYLGGGSDGRVDLSGVTDVRRGGSAASMGGATLGDTGRLSA